LCLASDFVLHALKELSRAFDERENEGFIVGVLVAAEKTIPKLAVILTVIWVDGLPQRVTEVLIIFTDPGNPRQLVELSLLFRPIAAGPISALTKSRSPDSV
jgi:hypothetical protein